jgi:hypothetical protein
MESHYFAPNHFAISSPYVVVWIITAKAGQSSFYRCGAVGDTGAQPRVDFFVDGRTQPFC